MTDRSKEIELLKAELETMKERHSPLPATKSDLDNVSTKNQTHRFNMQNVVYQVLRCETTQKCEMLLITQINVVFYFLMLYDKDIMLFMLLCCSLSSVLYSSDVLYNWNWVFTFWVFLDRNVFLNKGMGDLDMSMVLKIDHIKKKSLYCILKLLERKNMWKPKDVSNL